MTTVTVRARPGTALLLDTAGTILRPAEPVAQTYARMATAMGRRVTAAEVGARFVAAMQRARPLRAARPDWRPFWAQVVHECTGNDDPALLDALLDYFARADAWTVTAGAEVCARAVSSRGMKVAIVSNWDDRLRALLDALGITDWIDAAIISAEVGVEKPDRRIFERALARVQVAAEHTLHIGDDRGDDVDGARAAGCEVLHWPREVGSFAALTRRLLG